MSSQFGTLEQRRSKPQILKEIRETLAYEFPGQLQQDVDNVIIKLSQKKVINPEDIDEARDMLRKVKSKQKRSSSDMRNKHSKDLKQTLGDQRQQQQSSLAPSVSDHQLKTIISIKNPKRNEADQQLKLPNIVFSPGSNPTLNQTMNQALPPGSSNVSQNPFVSPNILNYRSKQFDTYHLKLQDDLKRYNQEKEQTIQSIKNSQAVYKDYLQKQMEQNKAQKMLKSQLNLEEGEQIQSLVTSLAQKEQLMTLKYRNQVRHIMDENDQVKSTKILSKQKDKEFRYKQDRDLADQMAQKDLQKILEEKLIAREKRRKQSKDLDEFIQNQRQSQQYSVTLKGDRSFGVHKFMSNNNSPRVSKHFDDSSSNLNNEDSQLINPFIDKADIVKHREKMQKLQAKVDQMSNLYDKYSISPKDQAITKLQEEPSFQTMLQEKQKQTQQERKQTDKYLVSYNQQLNNFKLNEQLQKQKKEIEEQRLRDERDQESAIRRREVEHQQKKQKQAQQQSQLDDQIALVKYQKQQELEKLGLAKEGELLSL